MRKDITPLENWNATDELEVISLNEIFFNCETGFNLYIRGRKIWMKLTRRKFDTLRNGKQGTFL